jgi:hypothetical protein
MPPDLCSSERERFQKAWEQATAMLTKGGVGQQDRSAIIESYATQRGLMDDVPEESRPPYMPMPWLQRHPFQSLQFVPDDEKTRQVWAVSTLIPVNYPLIEQYGLFDFMLCLMADQIYADEKRRLRPNETLYYDYLIEGLRVTLMLKV